MKQCNGRTYNEDSVNVLIPFKIPYMASVSVWTPTSCPLICLQLHIHIQCLVSVQVATALMIYWQDPTVPKWAQGKNQTGLFCLPGKNFHLAKKTACCVHTYKLLSLVFNKILLSSGSQLSVKENTSGSNICIAILRPSCLNLSLKLSKTCLCWWPQLTVGYLMLTTLMQQSANNSKIADDTKLKGRSLIFLQYDGGIQWDLVYPDPPGPSTVRIFR